MKTAYLAILVCLAAGAHCAIAAPAKPMETIVNGVAGFKDTPLIPNTQWHVHDPERPQPPVVKPASLVTEKPTAIPPSDAIVLFDGSDLSKWRDKDGNAAAWKLGDGGVTAAKGDIFTREEFGDVQLHLEFATPSVVKGTGQGRGNSGVFLMGRYEIQILDCYENLTYADGTIGAIYGQYPPLVNACRPPGQWQTYDILFTAPRFEANGTLKSPAYVTALLNGVLVQNHQSLMGPTGWRAVAKYTQHPATGPISLQDHGNPTRFRNIWVRRLEPAKQ
ncbi:MAG TPA: DUF1080 domain-containing protein [Verrucomicrobiae bacterium]|nr:DUF1080 domain-containing protein [Verrucomicrobiae bacterium]